MESPTQRPYPPSTESSAGTSSKLIQFPRMSNDNHLSPFHKAAKSTSSFLRCLPLSSRFRKSKRLSDTPIPRFYIEGRKARRVSNGSGSTERERESKMKGSVTAVPYSWPHDGSLDPKSTALVVIDMQNDFCSKDGYIAYQGYSIDDTLAIIPTIQSLITAFTTHSIPIYWTREGHRSDLSTLSSREHHRSRNNASGFGIGSPGPLGRLLIRGEPGHQIISSLSPPPSLENTNVIDKPGRSAFQHTEFGLMLRVKGIRNLVLVGVTTDVCVHSTMREANDNGFDCLLVEDATAASERHLHEGAVESVKAEGGIFGAVTTAGKILEALGEKSVDATEKGLGQDNLNGSEKL